MSDIEIARAANKKPIQEIGDKLGIPTEHLLPYGHDKAKISQDFINSVKGNDTGKLILVTAINPTPAGEGKTTTTVGLGDGLNAIGKKAMICIREASLGPNFGMKGGAAGGGYAQVVPMEDMNLHFTGDFHAITSAHSLLSAMIDNHIYWGNEQEIDVRRVAWRRVVDMNDRALRNITLSLGGVANGFPREGGYDITVASEVMAILCLSTDLADLQKRLGDMIVAYRRDRSPVYCRDIKADGAMTVLLKDAMQPNLVQTLENNPAFVHGGPFANIAHGCNTLVATRLALKLCDRVVTEAGFASDLGAEKFFHIKCRLGKLRPSAVVIVATEKAIEYHGGFRPDGGSGNLLKHVENMRAFGIEPVVAVNRFAGDTAAGLRKVLDFCQEHNVRAAPYEAFEKGPDGATELAALVDDSIAQNHAGSKFRFLYSLEAPLREKIDTIVREVYGGDGVDFDRPADTAIQLIEEHGQGQVPVCMAKTQKSISDAARLRGRPGGFRVRVNEVRLSAGAGFVVAICGEMMTMPGLPREPAAIRIRVDDDGNATGLA